MKLTNLKHIETQRDYEEYKKRVGSFLKRENIEVHSLIYDESNGDCEPFFSSIPCECCSRHLGGSRFTIKAGPIRGEMLTYDVCTDCVYYLEYGTLDDMTMMDLEDY